MFFVKNNFLELFFYCNKNFHMAATVHDSAVPCSWCFLLGTCHLSCSFRSFDRTTSDVPWPRHLSSEVEPLSSLFLPCCAGLWCHASRLGRLSKNMLVVMMMSRNSKSVRTTSLVAFTSKLNVISYGASFTAFYEHNRINGWYIRRCAVKITEMDKRKLNTASNNVTAFLIFKTQHGNQKQDVVNIHSRLYSTIIVDPIFYARPLQFYNIELLTHKYDKQETGPRSYFDILPILKFDDLLVHRNQWNPAPLKE